MQDLFDRRREEIKEEKKAKPVKEKTEKKEKKERKGFFLRNLSKSDSPFRNFISILIGYIDTVVLYNIFFIVTSIGIVTIGPAIYAIYKGYNRIIANQTDHRYRRFFKDVKENFNLEICLMGFILALLVGGIIYMFIFFFINTGNNQWMIVPWVAANFLLLYMVTFFSFYFQMKVKMDLPGKVIINNAFRLAAGSIRSIIFVLFSFAIFFLVPLIFLIFYTIPLFVLFCFSATFLSCMMSTYSTVEKYLIYTPEIEEKEEEIPDLKIKDIDENFLKDDCSDPKENRDNN